MTQESKKNQNQTNNMKKMNPDRKKKLDLALRKTEKKYDEVLKNLAK